MHISILDLDFLNFFLGIVVNFSELFEWVSSVECFSTLFCRGGASSLGSDAAGGEAGRNSQTESLGKMSSEFPGTWVPLRLTSL